jgi:hypothetical protein
MKNKVTHLTLAIFILAIASCSNSDNSPFTEGGGVGASNTDIVAANKLTIASSDVSPGFVEATYGTGAPPDNIAITEIITVDTQVIGGTLNISGYTADRAGFKTSGNNINFVSNYGSIEPSCSTTTGTCSVEFTTLGLLPPVTKPVIQGVSPTLISQSIFANFVIYTLGEESFFDANGNGFFDDADTFTFDTDEPYLDNDNNGQFDAGIDEPIDIDGDGTYTPPDGLYSGSNCQHSTLCSPNPRITIWNSMQLDLIN